MIVNYSQADKSVENVDTDDTSGEIPATQSYKSVPSGSGLPLPRGHCVLCQSIDRARDLFYSEFPPTLSACLQELRRLTDEERVQLCVFCIHVLGQYLSQRLYGIRLDQAIFGQVQGLLKKARRLIRENVPNELRCTLPCIEALNMGKVNQNSFTAADRAFIDIHDENAKAVTNRISKLEEYIHQQQSVAVPQPAKKKRKAKVAKVAPNNAVPASTSKQASAKAAGKNQSTTVRKNNSKKIGPVKANAQQNSQPKAPPKAHAEPQGALKRANSTVDKATVSAVNECKSLWAVDLPAVTGAYKNVLLAEPQKPNSTKSRLGYSSADIFFDASIMLERRSLEVSLDAADDEVITKRMRQEKRFLLFICANGALSTHRLTSGENWHDWSTQVSNKLQIDEDLFGSQWECEQVLVDVDLADPYKLFTCMNKLKGTFERIPDVILLAGGFPTILNDRSVFDGIYLPTNAQWANTIIQALIGVQKTFIRTQVVYAGFDVQIPADNTGYSIRQAVELVRQRSAVLYKMHRVYFADVLSHSATVQGAQLENWNRRKISLLLQLFRRVQLDRLLIDN